MEWITSWCSLQQSDFLNHRPGGSTQVGEQGQVGVGSCALRTGPCGFHLLPRREVEFDNRVPTWVLTLRIRRYVILFVLLQSRQTLCQRRVDLFDMVAELGRSEIWASVKDDHEFEHDFFRPSGTRSSPDGHPRLARRRLRSGQAVGYVLSPLR